MSFHVNHSSISLALAKARAHDDLTVNEAAALLEVNGDPLDELLDVAGQIRDEGLERNGRPGIITYSKKVFLPITRLCRDRCHYCVFVDTPGGLASRGIPAYMGQDEILDIARAGAAMGCKEALFTLGDRPETRWRAAADWLSAHGYASTIDYIADTARLVLKETGLIPHLNPGVMSWAEMQRLRPFAGSMGMMLETTATRLWSEPSGPHFGSPDKDPAVRLRVLENAGRSRIPFTTGVLLGIGENALERADALLHIRDLQRRFGHIQETIVQNFRAKPRTAMQNDPDFALTPYIAAVAVARIVMGPDHTIQAPPNLTDHDELSMLIRAGIDDWGGVSPLTADHVNPERPWPHLDELARVTALSGFTLHERLATHPEYLREADRWLDAAVVPRMLRLADTRTLLADDSAFVKPDMPPHVSVNPQRSSRAFSCSTEPEYAMQRALEQADRGCLDDVHAALLLEARGDDLDKLCTVADRVRAATGEAAITYVINRNIDTSQLGVTLDLDDIRAIVEDAATHGATEICMQGRPADALPGDIYLDVARTVHAANPDLSLHAFRPPELLDGARRMGIPLAEFLTQLRENGVTSVPGTAARVLHDDVRATLSEGKDPSVRTWIDTIEAAHRSGLPSTATLVYGHVETPAQIIAHLRTLQSIQAKTGRFSEFIAMPFVAGDAPASVAAAAGAGASTDYSRAVIAVSRLILNGSIDHIQAAWPKFGISTAIDVLRGGADDLGGVLLDGSMRPEAGPERGLELRRNDLEYIADLVGRPLQQRSTNYVPITGAPVLA